MQPHPRYEIREKIAAGDFATVFRARDRELNREVAVKQIHTQFLNDPRQLDLYWREAQLLAALEHPHVMTIYDIVRNRGWLILELMQGSLQQTAQGKPLEIAMVREALTGCLQALSFLHGNRVMHGDVKPSNLLLDKRGRIKLGDFGLARRASNDQGSLLKGTTRYMAPELISPQYGPVGPAADLYSLGFSAYELLCGSKFDSLFPSLRAFDRDKQIAWMMWHSADDRRLPDIHRVLEGVPDDLANVIQKLTQKRQALRYQSAAEALRDLKSEVPVVPDPDHAAQEAALQAARARKKRRFSAAAFVAGVALSAGIWFFPLERPMPAAAPPPEPVHGIVRSLLPEKRTLIIEVGADKKPLELVIRGNDRVFLNDKLSLLRELKEQDQVTLRDLKTPEGQAFLEIQAARPRQDRGRIVAIDLDERRLTVARSDGESDAPLEVTVPQALKVRLNDAETLDGKALALDDLKIGDLLVVGHYPEGRERLATSLAATRSVRGDGVVRRVDTAKREMTIALGTEQDAPLTTYSWAESCEISLNGRRFVQNQILKPADLLPGDVIAFERDVELTRIDAQRVFSQSGAIRNLRYDVRSIDLELDGGGTLTCLVGTECEVLLGGAKVSFDDLRRGDRVEFAHDSPEAESPTLTRLVAARPADPSKRLIVIGNAKYDDGTLSRIDHVAADARSIRDALVSRYAVPDDQATLLIDENRVRVEQAVAQALAEAASAKQLIVYVGGHAYRDDSGTVYLALKDFDFGRIDTTGLALPWLIQQLEKCPAKEKLLILDGCHAGSGADLQREPSTAEMAETVQGTKSAPGLRTVTVLASCSRGERGQVTSAGDRGRFATSIAAAYSGAADKNRDLLIEPTEVFDFVHRASAEVATGGRSQTPVLFLPDDTPPRLTEEAKQALRRLAANFGQAKIDLQRAELEYQAAAAAAGKQPEAKLLYGLLLLKAKQHPQALQHFEELQFESPELWLPWEANAWNRFEKQNYAAGINDLVRLVPQLAAARKPNSPPPPQALRILEAIGRLREFAGNAVRPERRPPAGILESLDEAVAQLGDEATTAYRQGRDHVRKITDDFDRRMTTEKAEMSRIQLILERTQLRHYAATPLDAMLQEILARMDE